MSRCRVASLVIAAGLLIAATAHGAVVHVRLTPVFDPHETIAATLIATPVCDSCDARAQRVDARGSGDVAVDLEGAAAWRLSVDSDRYWTATLSVSAHDGDVHSMTLWRASRLTGTLATTAVKTPISAFLRTAPGTEPALPETEIACTAAAGAWACVVPATKLDVRIVPESFIPQYFFDQVMPPEGLRDAGRLRLERGSSVAGWVRPPRGEAKGIAVELIPAGVAGRGDSRRAIRTLQATTNARGFFQFRGVPIGTWSIVAKRAGSSPARRDEVSVDAAREVVIARPLDLEPLGAVRVHVTPASAPGRINWTVRLMRAVPLSDVYAPIAESPADAGGAWQHEDVESGSYRVVVLDRRGTIFARRDVRVDGAVAELRVDTSAIDVRGTVSAGDEALKTTVILKAADGARGVFESDDDGAFSGTLPHEGRWEVELSSESPKLRLRVPAVDVRRREGDDFARVAIRLPGGRIEGRVDDESGAAVTDAEVAIFREGRVVSQALSDSKGTFRAIGLTPGPVVIEATADDESTGQTSYEVSEHDQPEARVTIRRAASLRGWLHDESGQAVAGALIRYMAGGATLLREVVTGPSGEFTLAVPRGAMANGVVLAPGFATKILQFPSSSSSAQRIDVAMTRASGALTIRIASPPPWPFVNRNGVAMALPLLWMPHVGSPPPGAGEGGFTVALEPGSYAICPSEQPSAGCITAAVVAGGAARVELPPVTSASKADR